MTGKEDKRQSRQTGNGDETSCAGESRGAFDNALLAQLPHLRNYALSLTQDPAEANDLVQDCVLRALEKRHQYTQDTYMRRWLFAILRNRYLDQWRQRNRRGRTVPVEDCRSAKLTHPASQDDWVELKECLAKLGELGPYDRSIVLLCILSPLSHREVAEYLDVAEGTVRSRLSRARDALRSGVAQTSGT